ncbi:MAG: type II secretion system F family protein [Hyphomonas sp.]|uniref:type II secretion system F family protein n=1 Tax=Hyphomonas sp. TaxID=87 RepID=UPI0035297271
MFDGFTLQQSLVPGLMFVAAMLLAIPGTLSFMRNVRAKDEVERRLERRGQPGSEPVKRRAGAFDEVVASFASKAAPTDEEEMSTARARLVQAGFTHPAAVGRYYLVRLLCVVVPQLLVLLALPYLGGLPPLAPLLISVGLVLAGLMGPPMVIGQRISKRQDQCSAGFPDMMDLMVACVEAGLSLDAAVQRVGEELETRHPVIADHMRKLSLELRAGKSRKTAWRSFADRMDLEDAGSLATMLRQAEEMGTSLGATLRIFSADMRQRRILMAEERAMALPAKLTLPLIFFVFPVLLGVLTLPAVVKIQSVMG